MDWLQRKLTVPDGAVLVTNTFLEPAHRPVAKVAYAIEDESRTLQRQRHARFVRQPLGVDFLAVAERGDRWRREVTR